MSGEIPVENPPPQVLAGGTPLIFDWRPVRWRKTRLMMALVVAAAGHLLVFYLFQVVTESSPRQAPPVREALILSGNEDATRRLLEAVDDRLPALSPSAPLEDSGGQKLTGLVKGYVPTWQDHRPALKPLPGQGGAGVLPSLMSGSAGILPALPGPDTPAEKGVPPAAVAAPATATADRPQPVLSFQTGLAGRALLAPPVWPPLVTAKDWPEEGPASFMMSVEPSGKVTSCLSLASTGLDEEEVEALRRVLVDLRFAPLAGGEQTAWAWVDVLW